MIKITIGPELRTISDRESGFCRVCIESSFSSPQDVSSERDTISAFGVMFVNTSDTTIGTRLGYDIFNENIFNGIKVFETWDLRLIGVVQEKANRMRSAGCDISIIREGFDEPVAYGIEIEAELRETGDGHEDDYGDWVSEDGDPYDIIREAINPSGLVSVSSDGSLDYGAEVNIGPVVFEELEKHITPVCKKLKSIGADIKDSCGGHIHIGAQAFKDIDHIKRARDIIHSNEEAFVAVSGRGEYYDFDDYSSFVTNDESRYQAVNLRNISGRHTVEFRFFGGTLDPNIIKTRIQLINDVVDASSVAGRAPSEYLSDIKSRDSYKQLAELEAL